MPAATQWALDSMTMREANAAAVRAVPTPQLLFEGGKRLVEAQGMTRIARRAAAQFLGINLPHAELALRLDAAPTSSGVVVVTEWLSEQVVPVASISMPAT